MTVAGEGDARASIVIVVADRDFGIIHRIFLFCITLLHSFFAWIEPGPSVCLFEILIGRLVLENVAVRRRGDGGKDW